MWNVQPSNQVEQVPSFFHNIIFMGQKRLWATGYTYEFQELSNMIEVQQVATSLHM